MGVYPRGSAAFRPYSALPSCGESTPTIPAPRAGAQSSFREPMLLAVLDWGIVQVASVAELILLGDVVDLWTSPPAERSPSFAAVVVRRPAIFALVEGAIIARAYTVLDGAVIYVAGNHDLQEDLAERLLQALGDRKSALPAGLSTRKTWKKSSHDGRCRALCRWSISMSFPARRSGRGRSRDPATSSTSPAGMATASAISWITQPNRVVHHESLRASHRQERDAGKGGEPAVVPPPPVRAQAHGRGTLL